MKKSLIGTAVPAIVLSSVYARVNGRSGRSNLLFPRGTSVQYSEPSVCSSLCRMLKNCGVAGRPNSEG